VIICQGDPNDFVFFFHRLKAAKLELTQTGDAVL
jgi:hypothetical protein